MVKLNRFYLVKGVAVRGNPLKQEPESFYSTNLRFQKMMQAVLVTRKADEPFATRRPLTKTPAVWILLSQKGRANKSSSVDVAHGRAKTHCVFASAVQVGQRLLYSLPAVALAPQKIYYIFCVSALEVLTSVLEIRKGIVYPFAGALFG